MKSLRHYHTHFERRRPLRPHNLPVSQVPLRTDIKATADPAVAQQERFGSLRADFPILSREIHGRPLVYLDSASSAQKPTAVLEAMDHAMRFEYANVHRGIHLLSNAATQN